MKTSTERLIDYHLARLNDRDPQVRIKSINELALLDAVGALEALETVYRTDSEQSVRRAAQIAGKKLYHVKRGQSSVHGG